MDTADARTSMDHSITIAAVLEEIERYKQYVPILLKELNRNEFERDSKQSASRNGASAQ